MITRIAKQFQNYPTYSEKTVGPCIQSMRSDSVVNRQHVQLSDKNGNTTYILGTYQSGGGSGYKLLLYTAFECVTDEVMQDMIIIFDYPADIHQTPMFQQAEKKLKKMTKGCKNIRVMNWAQFEKWSASWQKKNKVGAVPRKRASVIKDAALVETPKRGRGRPKKSV